MSYETVRERQRTLYRAAKAEGDRRFHSRGDKLGRPDVLERAWELVKRNKGSYGVDRQSIADIEAAGVEAFLAGIATEWREGATGPARSGGSRSQARQAGQDQAAVDPDGEGPGGAAGCRLVIEPILEAQFLPNSLGFRPSAAPRTPRWPSRGG